MKGTSLRYCIKRTKVAEQDRVKTFADKEVEKSDDK
jgi:hypothetical protein